MPRLYNGYLVYRIFLFGTDMQKRFSSPLRLTVLDRMIVSDIGKTLLAVLSVLLLIIISHKLVRYLAKAVEGEISGQAIFSLLSLNMVSMGVVLLPASLFLSVLMVLGRMHRDNEMAALAAGGVGLPRILRAVFTLVIPLSFLAAILALQLQPWAVDKSLEVMAYEAKTVDVRGISAGHFSEYSRGDIVFYVEKIDEEGKLNNVFIQNRQEGQLGIVSSEGGYLRDDPKSGGRFIVLQNGYRYQGLPGEVEYRITQFEEYAVRVGEATDTVKKTKREAKSSHLLWVSEDARDMAELQRRISLPIVLLILAFLAVPLSHVAPRGGVYGNVLVALLIYLVYENLMRVSQSWIASAAIPSWIGLWWVHLLVLLVAGVLMVRSLGLSWCKTTLGMGRCK
jgi:lipopolysaccharide export system permease protein